MVVCTFQNSNMMSELRGVCNRYQRRWRNGMSRALEAWLDIFCLDNSNRPVFLFAFEDFLSYPTRSTFYHPCNCRP